MVESGAAGGLRDGHADAEPAHLHVEGAHPVEEATSAVRTSVQDFLREPEH